MQQKKNHNDVSLVCKPTASPQVGKAQHYPTSLSYKFLTYKLSTQQSHVLSQAWKEDKKCGCGCKEYRGQATAQ